MKRVPASIALLALRQYGHEIAPATLRSWVRREHISQTDDGYDLTEIVAYLDRRATTSRD